MQAASKDSFVPCSVGAPLRSRLETIAEHVLSQRWSQCVVETHVQTSIESVRVISRLLLMASRHAGEAYRTRRTLSAVHSISQPCKRHHISQGLSMARRANRPSPWAETAIPQRASNQAYCTSVVMSRRGSKRTSHDPGPLLSM